MQNSVPQSRQSYSVDEVSQISALFRDRLRFLIDQNPELTLVMEEFNEVVRPDTDPLKELAALLGACTDVITQMKYLLNPTTLPLHMSDDGRVLTRTFEDVATFVTDIRGFTELTKNVTKHWGISVFDLLSYCYFPQITEMLERYGCHYLNYTGDGLLVLVTERSDAEGRVVLPSLDLAVLCALDLIGLTNSIAEAWRRLGLVQDSGDWHETGLGLACGNVEVGDPFVPDRANQGPCAKFNEVMGEILQERMPHFQPRKDFAWRVRSIHAMSPAINLSSRLQDADKLAPGHSIIMTAIDIEQLCPPLRARAQHIGTMTFKGIGEVDVFGFDRFARIDVPALEKECLAHYAAQRT